MSEEFVLAFFATFFLATTTLLAAWGLALKRQVEFLRQLNALAVEVLDTYRRRIAHLQRHRICQSCELLEALGLDPPPNIPEREL